MDDELLRTVYHYLKNQPALTQTRDCTYSVATITLIEFFKVAQHLSGPEALNRSRWPLWARKLRFPSLSQFNRRVKTAPVQAAVAEVSDQYRRQLPHGTEKACDGKPLLVGGFSKDPDAAVGKAPGGWAKGYRLHAIVDAGGAVEAWEVTDLRAAESTVARRMVAGVDLQAAVVRADANYDSVKLYEAVAAAGGRLVARRRKAGRGLGHHPQHADRLQAIAELEQCPGGQAAHDQHRLRVEQIFGRLTSLTFALWGLPAYVRRLERVKRWVNAKLALYHVHLATEHRKRQSHQAA